MTWMTCTHSSELKVNHRQGADTSGFREALWNLRCGDTTEKDYKLFASRGESRVGSAGFEDAIYLVATHALEGEFNYEKLRALRQSVYRIKVPTQGAGRLRTPTSKTPEASPRSYCLLRAHASCCARAYGRQLG